MLQIELKWGGQEKEKNVQPSSLLAWNVSWWLQSNTKFEIEWPTIWLNYCAVTNMHCRICCMNLAPVFNVNRFMWTWWTTEIKSFMERDSTTQQCMADVNFPRNQYAISKKRNSEIATRNKYCVGTVNSSQKHGCKASSFFRQWLQDRSHVTEICIPPDSHQIED